MKMTKSNVMGMILLAMLFFAGCAAPTAPTNPRDLQVLNDVQGVWMWEGVLQGNSPVTLTLTFSGQEVNICSTNRVEGHGRSNDPFKDKAYNGYTKAFEVEDGNAVFYFKDGAKAVFHLVSPDVMETPYRGDIIRAKRVVK
ncbi:MAG: hypothetical protein WC022_04355 [Parcubacteria group bacterium]